jgi:hypothetical protein
MGEDEAEINEEEAVTPSERGGVRYLYSVLDEVDVL